MGKVTSDEYLEKLAELDALDLENEGEGKDELTLAEQLAMNADKPEIRKDGNYKNTPSTKKLTSKQLAFTQGLIEGLTLKDSYRRAYPDSRGNDACTASNASKLARDPRIKRLVENAQEEVIEYLSEDVASTKRYVLKQLLAHSKSAKQEGTKLKALELLGKSVGLFIDKTQAEVKTQSADELKKELASHLKLLDNVKPLKRQGTV